MPILDLDSISDKDSKPITLAELRRRLKEHPNDPQFKKLNKELVESLSLVTQNLNSALISNVQGVLVSYNQNAMAALGAAIQPNFPAVFLLSEALKPTKELFRITNAVAESNRRLVEAFQIPNYLSESLKIFSEQINQLYEPSRFLSQTFAMYKTPNLFNQLTALNTNWIVPGYMPTETIKDKESYTKSILEEAEIFSKEIENLRIEEPDIIYAPFTYYEPTKFLLLKVEVAAVIQFYPKRASTRGENTNVIDLFEVLYKFLEEKGQEIGGFKRVFITTKELITKLIAKGVKDPNEYWIKNAKNSFLNHKVKPLEILQPVLTGVIQLWYDKKNNGYYFQIKVKNSLPQLD